MIKRRLLKLLNNSVASQLLSGLEHAGEARPLLRVLTYHHVAEPDAYPHLSSSIVSVRPSDFAAQMRCIAKSYTPVSAQAVLDYFELGTRLPPRAVLITFDDAYRDFAENAWSVLRALGIPVVLFVPTAYPDHPERILWWDRLYDAMQRTSNTSAVTQRMTLSLGTPYERYRAYKQLRTYVKTLPHSEAMQFVDALCDQLQVTPHGDNCILSWHALKRLAADGVILGAHTRTHPLLNRISEDEAEQEAIGSLNDLRQQVPYVPPIFAYPGGNISPAVVTRIRRAGLKLGFTTDRGINRLDTADALLLKRINVGRSTSVNLLRAQLLSAPALIPDRNTHPNSVLGAV